MAPGEDIYTTTVHKHCTSENPGPHCYTRVTGTSFAAPHVSGAAAVVWAAFPNKIGNQVVERLLTTARRFADQEEEVSEIYGHGALDLGAALAPVGSMSLPVQGRGMVPVSDSAMRLPPGFAAPSGASFRMDAIAYDEQMFPFRQDLAGAFHAAGARASESALRGFLSSLGRSSSVAPLGRGAAVSFTHDDDAFDSAPPCDGSGPRGGARLSPAFQSDTGLGVLDRRRAGFDRVVEQAGRRPDAAAPCFGTGVRSRRSRRSPGLARA